MNAKASSKSKSPAPLQDALMACRRHFAFAALFSALINVLYLTPTFYMLQVYDRVISTGGLTTLFFISVVTVFCLIVLALFEWLRSRLLVRSGAKLEKELAGSVLSAVLAQPNLPRAARSQATRDFDTFRQAVTGSAALAAMDAPWLIIYLGAAFLLSPALGVVTLFAAGVLVLLAWMNEKATHAPLKTANDAASLAYAAQDYAAASSEVVRALGMRRALVQRQIDERHNVIDLQTDASFSASGYSSLIRFFRLAMQSGALGLGAYLAVNRDISGGAIMAASLLMTRALGPIEQLVGSWKSVIQGRDAYARLKTLLLAEAIPRERTLLPQPKGFLSVEQLSVLAPERNRMILSDITFQMAPGEIVGLVGPSGAGKSTLSRVVAGAVEPDKGLVRIDGAALGEWDPERLATHIGYLPQDFALFAGSVKDNIGRFRRHLGVAAEELDMAVVAAARAAGAHDMIQRLPHGYDTQLGLGGTGLSSGQAQRVALARALLGDPALLILDEPNAHLDTESELILFETVAAAKARGAAVLVIAHRSRLLQMTDRVMVLDNGRIRVIGRMDEVTSVHPGGPTPGPRRIG